MTSNLTPLQQLMFSLIEIWQASGQSQRIFCQEKDLAYSKFHYWYKKYQEYQSPSATGEPRPDESVGRAFVSVTLKKASTLETVPAGVLEFTPLKKFCLSNSDDQSHLDRRRRIYRYLSLRNREKGSNHNHLAIFRK